MGRSRDMLQPEYKRDMQKNYMIFREESGLDYCMKMLASFRVQFSMKLMELMCQDSAFAQPLLGSERGVHMVMSL